MANIKYANTTFAEIEEVVSNKVKLYNPSSEEVKRYVYIFLYQLGDAAYNEDIMKAIDLLSRMDVYIDIMDEINLGQMNFHKYEDGTYELYLTKRGARQIEIEEGKAPPESINDEDLIDPDEQRDLIYKEEGSKQINQRIDQIKDQYEALIKRVRDSIEDLRQKRAAARRARGDDSSSDGSEESDGIRWDESSSDIDTKWPEKEKQLRELEKKRKEDEKKKEEEDTKKKEEMIKKHNEEVKKQIELHKKEMQAKKKEDDEESEYYYSYESE